MTSRFDLAGRVALVTGASSGLGRHFALTLAASGARVAVAARRLERLRVVADEIAAAGGRALAVEMDVTDRASVERALDHTETELGPLGIVVNNAGIVAPAAALEQSEEQWNGTLATDLNGAWRVAQCAAKRMVAHGQGGSIVNIASIAALRPSSGVAAYSAAKAALVSLTQSLANELARYNIRVNAIAPGFISTDLNAEYLQSPPGQALCKRIPQRRFGAPADLDGPLLLLASDAGAHMTGAVVVVDGGHSINPL